MFNVDDFKVELINKDEVKDFVKKHGEFACQCYATDKKFSENVGRDCLKSGHFSGSRCDYFKFEISNVPRSLIDQLIRHEQGFVKNVQSFRYVNKEGFDMYCPPEVDKDPCLSMIFSRCEKNINDFYTETVKYLNSKGLSGEKANEIARHMLPIGCESAVTIGCTIESLIHLANIRLCNRAEFPIRMLTQMMISEVKKITNEYDDLLICKCDRDLYCIESKCCGRRPTKKELLKKIKEINTQKESINYENPKK